MVPCCTHAVAATTTNTSIIPSIITSISTSITITTSASASPSTTLPTRNRNITATPRCRPLSPGHTVASRQLRHAEQLHKPSGGLTVDLDV